ncbi:MAG TPA: hypothetical protein VK589_03915 [Chryseolinea sp.]|nr:hypothetical protein [Chryseolinea sp.]
MKKEEQPTGRSIHREDDQLSKELKEQLPRASARLKPGVGVRINPARHDE